MILSYVLFPDGLSQDGEYSSPCSVAGPCCLSIPYIILHLWPQTPVHTPHPPSHLAATSLFSVSVSLFPFHRQVRFCHSLDST